MEMETVKQELMKIQTNYILRNTQEYVPNEYDFYHDEEDEFLTSYQRSQRNINQ